VVLVIPIRFAKTDLKVGHYNGKNAGRAHPLHVPKWDVAAAEGEAAGGSPVRWVRRCSRLVQLVESPVD